MKAILTNVVIETHQSPCEFPLVLHQDPDRGTDTSVDEFEGENCASHLAMPFLPLFLFSRLKVIYRYERNVFMIKIQQ